MAVQTDGSRFAAGAWETLKRSLAIWTGGVAGFAIRVGRQIQGFGDAAKAVEALQRGITKGVTAPDVAAEKQGERVDEAYMTLGLAHLKNNNKAEAAKAFRLVKRDPIMVRIAKLWLLNT